MTERNTYVWFNPIYKQTEVILETPLVGGTQIGGVAKIVDGKILWFPDIDGQRLQPAGITRENIVEDLQTIAVSGAPLLPFFLVG